MIECDSLRVAVSGFSLVRSCDRIASGALRVSTPFVYPDGSFIDVFIEASADLFSGIIVSDLGQTADFLLHLNLPPWATKKRQRAVADICRVLGVEMKAGKIQTQIGGEDQKFTLAVIDDQDRQKITQAILRVVQACLRISDLYLTKQLRTPNVYRDEVEEFLGYQDLPVECGVALPGKHTRELHFDFRVQGKSTLSLVQTLSSGHAAVAHNQANEALIRWLDLAHEQRRRHQLLTVFDSTVDVFRDDDLARLSEESLVLPFPAEAQQIAKSLAA